MIHPNYAQCQFISESGNVWGHFRYHAIVMLRQFCDLSSTFKMVKCFYFLGKWWSFTNLTGFGKFFAGSNHITNSTNLSRPSLFSVFCWVKLMRILQGNCHGLFNRGKLFRIRPTSKVRPMAMTSPTLCMAEPGGKRMDDDDRRVESWFTDVLEELLISKPSCGLPGTCVYSISHMLKYFQVNEYQCPPTLFQLQIANQRRNQFFRPITASKGAKKIHWHHVSYV